MHWVDQKYFRIMIMIASSIMIEFPELIIGNFAKDLDVNVVKTAGTIMFRRFWKMSGLRSHGTLRSKQIGILLILWMI